MKKQLLILGSLLAVSSLMADTVSTVGGYGTWQAGNGGEFTLKVNDSSSGLDINGNLSYYNANALNQVSGSANQPSFQTFCVEGTEYIYPNSTYDFGISQTTIFNGTTLTKGAGYLYYEFATGGLSAYDYANTSTGGRKGSASELQNALWYFMGQESQSYSASNPYEFLANSLFGGDAFNTDTSGNVGVLNLWAAGQVGTTDGKRQDQLILTGNGGYSLVPDGGTTLGLLGLALSGLGLIRRKICA